MRRSFASGLHRSLRSSKVGHCCSTTPCHPFSFTGLPTAGSDVKALRDTDYVPVEAPLTLSEMLK
jgi:hypothetical protein